MSSSFFLTGLLGRIEYSVLGGGVTADNSGYR